MFTRSAARHSGAIPPWRASRDPHECSREVRMVGEASVLRDGRNSFFTLRELRARPCDTSAPDVLAHRATESASEQFGQVHGMDASET